MWCLRLHHVLRLKFLQLPVKVGVRHELLRECVAEFSVGLVVLEVLLIGIAETLVDCISFCWLSHDNDDG